MLGFQSGSKPIKLRALKLATGFDAASAGLVAADIDGDGKPELIAWSNGGIKIFRNGSPGPIDRMTSRRQRCHLDLARRFQQRRAGGPRDPDPIRRGTLDKPQR